MSEELPPLPEPDGSATRDLGPAGPGYVEGARLQEEVAAWSEPLVRAYGAECARLAIEKERERCAHLVETTPAEAFCTVMHQGQLQRARETFAIAIRTGETGRSVLLRKESP